MRACLKIAFEIVNKIISGEDFDLSKKVAEIKIIARDSQLGVSTQTILDAASRRNIPWRRLSTTSSLFQLGYGKNRRLLLASTTDQTSLISTDIVQDKFLTKNMLKRNFLPSPDGVIVERAEDLKNIFDSLKPPFVVKPYNGNQGKGVVLNVTCPLELNSAFHYAQKFSDSVLIEEMVFGNDYRILIVDKKLLPQP